MNAILKTLSWSDRPKISKHTAMVIGLVVTLIVAFFKLKPYFNESPTVTPAPHHESKSTGGLSTLLEHVTLNGSSSAGGKGQARTGRKEGGMARDHQGPAIIERPLFDGLTVTLRAELLNAVSSHQSDTLIEARALELIRDDGTSDVDGDPAVGAKLAGTMSVNLALKRIGFVFSEFVSREGRSYSVTGTVIDPETKMAGVVADYSSGLGSRLLGVALDQGITLADQIGMAKVLEATTGGQGSQVTQEVQTASMVVSQQASSSISSEATRSLRETPAELSLPAGTPLVIRLKALPQGARP